MDIVERDIFLLIFLFRYIFRINKKKKNKFLFLHKQIY